MSVSLVSNKEPTKSVLYHHRDLEKIRALLENPPLTVTMLTQVLYERMTDIDLIELFVKIADAAHKQLQVDNALSFFFTFEKSEKGTIPPLILVIQIVRPHTSVLEVIERIPLSLVDNTSMKCLSLKYIPEPVKKNFFVKLWDSLFKRSKE